MKRTIAIAILLSALCRASFAVMDFSIESPLDDSDARKGISGNPELQPLAAEYRDLVSAHLFPLTRDNIERVFGPTLETATNWWGYAADAPGKHSGPKLDRHPTDLVLPILVACSNSCSGGMMLMVSGLHTGDPTKDKSHTDLHAISDIGYAEFYYQLDGERVQNAVLYFRADDKFIPLKSTKDFAQRLEWEKRKFEALKKWLDTHVVAVENTKRLSPDAATKGTK